MLLCRISLRYIYLKIIEQQSETYLNISPTFPGDRRLYIKDREVGFYNMCIIIMHDLASKLIIMLINFFVKSAGDLVTNWSIGVINYIRGQKCLAIHTSSLIT